MEMRKYSLLIIITVLLGLTTGCTKSDPGRGLAHITLGTKSLGNFTPGSQIAYIRPEGFIVKLSSDTISFTILLPEWNPGEYSITNEPFPDGKAIFNIDFNKSSHSASSGSVTITDMSNTGISGTYSVTGSYYGSGDLLKISNGIFNNVQLESIVYGAVEDREHNQYKTVVIGSQTWMAENLKSRIYANGDSIKEVYRYSNNDGLVNINGLLYTWNSSTNSINMEMTQGVCPDGWHLPSNSEWKLLIDDLGGDNLAGGKMKSLVSWHAINRGSDNISGFSALGSGMHYPVAEFPDLSERMGVQAFYLSSTLDTTIGGIPLVWAICLNNSLREVWRVPYFRGDMGFSVRCIKN